MGKEAIVVTGSSGGLGAATTEVFLAAGYRVVGLDRSAEGIERAGLTRMGVDVSSDTQVSTVFEQITRDHDVAGLVHCAGVADFGPTRPGQLLAPGTGEVLDNLERIESTLHVNLLGSFVMVRHAAAAMARREPGPDGARGFITLTSSGAALDGKAGQSAYSASKSGIIGMTLPLARELSRWGIRVNTIAPGLFDTPILDGTPPLERHVPFPPRVGDPREYASLALHIAHNTYFNAEVVRLDGGIRGGFVSTTPFIR